MYEVFKTLRTEYINSPISQGDQKSGGMLHDVSLSPSFSPKSTQKYFTCELGFNLHSTVNNPV